MDNLRECIVFPSCIHLILALFNFLRIHICCYGFCLVLTVLEASPEMLNKIASQTLLSLRNLSGKLVELGASVWENLPSEIKSNFGFLLLYFDCVLRGDADVC